MTNHSTAQPFPIAHCEGAITRRASFLMTLLLLAAGLTLTPRAQAQKTTSSPNGKSTTTAQPVESAMTQAAMDMGKLNENHKLLASLDGTWSYNVKMWMNGDTRAKPMTSTGTAVRKSVMDGHYVTQDVSGTMDMPGPDGRMTATPFEGHSTEGFDNAQQKFVALWYDSMGTGFVLFVGTYDQANKTFTYTGTVQVTPSMSMKVRETLRLTDNDHMVMEWFEHRGQRELKTMEIDYTRQH